MSKEQPELKRLFKLARHPTARLLALGILALLFPRLATGWYARSRTFDVENAPQKRLAIVFGARVLGDGSPTPALKDRVATAADLYFAGKVEKLLMSGDNRFVDYNEPQGMKDYAVSLGVPGDAIVLDYAGRRTYDTCYRARDIFKVQEAMLVTDDYHLPRAIYICNTLGVRATGVPAQRHLAMSRRNLLYMNLRELPATLLALWDVHVSRPLPVLGEPEPIFASGSTVSLQEE
jgi:SanA protein